MSYEMLKLPWTQWWMTLVWCVTSFGFILLGQWVSQIHGMDHEFGQPPLYDVVHTYLPDLSPYYYMNTVYVVLAFIRFFWIDQSVQQFLYLVFLAMDIRAVGLMVTSQPTCIPQCFSDGGSWPLNTCFDFLFSGHTVCITVTALAIIRDTKPSIYEKICWAFYIPLCGLWIAMSKQHYGIDVLIGMLVGTLISMPVNMANVRKELSSATSGADNYAKL